MVTADFKLEVDKIPSGSIALTQQVLSNPDDRP
jgi:hypothetical protein